MAKKKATLLDVIKEGTLSEAGHVVVEHNDELKALIEAGHVEVNHATLANGKIAARIKPSALPAVVEATAKPSYEILAGLDMPVIKQTRGIKQESYPFSQLAVGASFRVDTPFKNFASTIVQAQRRFATPSGQTKVTAKGKTMNLLTYTRRFKGFPVTAGQTYANGFSEPADGTRVFRIE